MRSRVHPREEHVVGDVVQVAAELEPGPGRRDVVRGALALDLEQHGQVVQVLAVPRLEGVQQLEPLGLRVDHHLPETGGGGGESAERHWRHTGGS